MAVGDGCICADKLKFPGQKLLRGVVMAFMMVPFQLMIVPLFLLVTKMNLLGTYTAMILQRRQFVLYFLALFQYGKSA